MCCFSYYFFNGFCQWILYRFYQSIIWRKHFWNSQKILNIFSTLLTENLNHGRYVCVTIVHPIIYVFNDHWHERCLYSYLCCFCKNASHFCVECCFYVFLHDITQNFFGKISCYFFCRAYYASCRNKLHNKLCGCWQKRSCFSSGCFSSFSKTLKNY